MGPLHDSPPTSGLVCVYVCACVCVCLSKQMVWQSKTDGHMSIQCVCELCFQGMKQTSNAIFITAVWLSVTQSAGPVHVAGMGSEMTFMGAIEWVMSLTVRMARTLCPYKGGGRGL